MCDFNCSQSISIPLTIFTRGQFWPLGIVIACVRRPSVTKFVRAITHHPLKLESPNINHRCKRPQLSSLVLGGDWPWPSRSNLTSQNFPHFEFVKFVCVISHHLLKLGFPNMDQICILALLRSLLIWGSDWPRSSVLFFISNQLLFPKFASFINLHCFVFI